MYELLIVLIVLLFLINKTREHFAFRFVKEYPFYSTENGRTDGYEVLSLTPHTCPPDRSDLDAGLCYVPCRAGYSGVGPVCWADSVSVGIGKAIGLEPCPDGWNNDGLICREPIRNDCSWKALGVCWGKLSGGRLRGRLNNGGICDWPDKDKLPRWLTSWKNNALVYKGTFREVPQDKVESTDPATVERKRIMIATHPDRVAGLCYKKCPKDYPQRIPGMPYLCYKGGPLSYGRGVGTVPPITRLFGRYSFI